MVIFNPRVGTFVEIYCGWPSTTEACLQPCLEHYFRCWQKKKQFGPAGPQRPLGYFLPKDKIVFFLIKTSVGPTVKKLPYHLKLFDRINLSFQFLTRQTPAMGEQDDGLLQGRWKK